MIPRERTPFSAIVDRPPLRLPGGARLVVWTIVNLEFWDIARPMARQVLPAPTGQVLLPDVPNWSWHEYGMRVGGLAPGLTQTYDTPELLAGAGIKYIGDWVYDDEPTEIATASGPLVTLPYTVELNDIPMMLVQHHESEYFTRRCIDTSDRLY